MSDQPRRLDDADAVDVDTSKAFATVTDAHGTVYACDTQAAVDNVPGGARPVGAAWRPRYNRDDRRRLGQHAGTGRGRARRQAAPLHPLAAPLDYHGTPMVRRRTAADVERDDKRTARRAARAAERTANPRPTRRQRLADLRAEHPGATRGMLLPRTAERA